MGVGRGREEEEEERKRGERRNKRRGNNSWSKISFSRNPTSCECHGYIRNGLTCFRNLGRHSERVLQLFQMPALITFPIHSTWCQMGNAQVASISSIWSNSDFKILNQELSLRWNSAITFTFLQGMGWMITGVILLIIAEKLGKKLKNGLFSLSPTESCWNCFF